MRKASPSWAASSSATTRIDQAAARLMRATSMMPGSEWGSTTRLSTVMRPAPSVYEALMISCGTERDTSATISRLKNTEPSTIRVILGVSSMPSQNSITGTSAVAGMYRMKPVGASSSDSTDRKVPISSPRTTAITMLIA